MEILFGIIFIMVATLISYFFAHWIAVFALAIANGDAKYDESSKMAILSLARKDRIWKDVAKILDLEN